ncbi:MAG: T9SS type A sorting domain-containing protein [Bacteroidales bacterium]|nr:T9SS type A sorting domain-containing protein [Bacteroidales bacterium]
MKKLLSVFIILLSINTLSAQWTTDPTQNTLLATGSNDYGEILFSTHKQSGNTYIQWCSSHANGWSPSIQKVDSLGNALWGNNGIHISGPKFAPYSYGITMAALADGGVVSCFADSTGHCIAVKIDDNGNFEWGEEGIVALATNSCLRTKLVPGHNGGFWVMAHDDHSLHFRYYHSDGTPVCDQITISDENDKNVAFGQMVLDENDNVFALYQKEQPDVATYFFKSLYVTKYATDGTQLSQEEKLMDDVSISGEIFHSACPDGMGGGYAWISHAALNNFFEVYLFHFDSIGHSTISAPTGLIVSQPDGLNYHLCPSASLHPTSHDLLMTFGEVDKMYQTTNGLRVNRITADGTKLWGNSGIAVVPMTEDPISYPIIDAFSDGSGASITYKFNENSVVSSGIDANGNTTWHTTLATPTSDLISLCDASSGYHNGQTVLAWQGTRNNLLGLYGQNLHQDGTVGPLNETSIGETNKELFIYQSDNCLNINGVDIRQIELINLTGQRVKVASTNTHSLAVGDLPQGIYIVRILTSDGKMVNQKVMIR